MVFVLRHVENGELLILGHHMTYTLGRSRRNNIHLKDLTVNKWHALMEITDSYADIEDKDTDFGTSVNKQRITSSFRLRSGDVIVFGKKNCKYVFLDPKFEAQIDKNVSKLARSTLAQTFKKLNVNFVPNYLKTCTHLIIESVSLDTLKDKTILYYLIERKTVVEPRYFTAMLEYIKEAPLMPNIYRYMPKIEDDLKKKGIEDINPRKKRRHIFENSLFIFFDGKQNDELSDLIVKCGGENLLYSPNKTFFEQLFNDINRYEYILVNHHSNGKKDQPMYSFLKNMKQRKKKVLEVSCDDMFIAILKGEMVYVNYEPLSHDTNPKDPQPSTSKKPDIVILDGPESGESDSADTISQRLNPNKSNTKTGLEPVNSFSRLAAAYKKEKTLRESILERIASSSTVNNWVTRSGVARICPKVNEVGSTKNNHFAKRRRIIRPLQDVDCDYDFDADETIIEGSEMKKNNSCENEFTDSGISRMRSGKSQDRDKNEKATHQLSTDVDTDDDLETNADITIRESISTSFILRKKHFNTLSSNETEEQIHVIPNNMLKHGHSEEQNTRAHSRVNSKSVVINPLSFASRERPHVDNQDMCSNLEKWHRKYLNVEITPM